MEALLLWERCVLRVRVLSMLGLALGGLVGGRGKGSLRLGLAGRKALEMRLGTCVRRGGLPLTRPPSGGPGEAMRP
jgi:hypothetical protein